MYKITYGGKVKLMHLTFEGGRRMKDKVGKEQCYSGNKCVLKILKNNPGKPNSKKLNKKAKYKVHLKIYIITLVNTGAKIQTFLNNRGNIKKEKKYILKKRTQKIRAK